RGLHQEAVDAERAAHRIAESEPGDHRQQHPDDGGKKEQPWRGKERAKQNRFSKFGGGHLTNRSGRSQAAPRRHTCGVSALGVRGGEFKARQSTAREVNPPIRWRAALVHASSCTTACRLSPLAAPEYGSA